jgi:hypothetical protein
MWQKLVHFLCRTSLGRLRSPAPSGYVFRCVLSGHPFSE